MSHSTNPSPWPSPYKSAISFTMDNLGEAQDVLNNAWPHPIGTHPAVTNQLPRMLALLRQHGVRATYFAEGWSLGVYPDAVRALVEEGHEVAWHGWMHERWERFRDRLGGEGQGGDGDADGDGRGEGERRERESFEKSWAAAEKAGVKYRGFRPPGGEVNERTWRLMREYGFEYISPLGEFGTGPEGVVVLPFEWKAVDAFWYMDKFSGIRKEHGEREEVLDPRDFGEWLMGKIDEATETGGYMSILFHPFLQTSVEKFNVLEEVLERISTDGKIWVAPCHEVAQWVKEHPEEFISSRGN